MQRILAASLVICLVLATWPSPALSSDVEAAIKRWEDAWISTRSFTSEVSSHIVKGDNLEERTLRLWFKRPLNIRTDILRGNRSHDAGSVAVYRGDGKVSGHQGGLLSGIVLTLPVDDALCTSIRGATITELLFSHPLEVIYQYRRRRASLQLGPATQIAGRPAVPLTLTTTNENFIALNDNVYKDVLWYDTQLNVIVQWERFEKGDQKIAQVVWANTRLNPEIDDAIFNPRVEVR